MQDLRSFLGSAEKAGELLRVDRETDPLTEMGVLFGETEHPLIFENVRGYPAWQICGELVTSRAAQAVALQIERSQVVPELARRMQSAALPGRNVNTGPVKERILTGRDVDLRKLPVVVHSQEDGGTYIGSAMCVSRVSSVQRSVGIGGCTTTSTVPGRMSCVPRGHTSLALRNTIGRPGVRSAAVRPAPR